MDPETGEPLFDELYSYGDESSEDYPASSSWESEEIDEYQTSDEY